MSAFQRVTSEAVKRKYRIVKIYEEVGSGMNDNRSKFKQQNLFRKIKMKTFNYLKARNLTFLAFFC